MEPATARGLLLTGATLVVAGLPAGSEFGIDMNTHTTGDKFMGVKMIPPGLHFVYFSSRSEYDQRSLSPRSGFFKVFDREELCVKKWNRAQEDLDPTEATDEEVSRYRDNLVGSLDQFLAPYDLSSFEKWSGLSDYITSDVVCKMNPRSGRIHSAAHLIPQPFSSSTHNRHKTQEAAPPPDQFSTLTLNQMERLLPQLQEEASSVINFSKIAKSRVPSGCPATDVTKYSLDSSHVLQALIDQNAGSSESVLGEIQFSFVSFLVGHHHEAFTHWKDMIRLICTSNHALQTHDSFFLNFIRVLHFQLQEVPADLFVDIVNSNNFLLLTLKDLFFNLENNDAVSPELRSRGERFRGSLERKFGWDFSVENSDNDEAPVVVSLDA